MEEAGQHEASQWHCHDQDKGEGQGCHRRFHHPEQHNAGQLNAGEEIHSPGLHLGR